MTARATSPKDAILHSKMKRPRIAFSLRDSWQVISTIIIVGAGIYLLLFSQLGSLLPAYSQAEVDAANASRNLSTIVHDPVNAPHKLAVFGYTYITDDRLLATRLASATFAVGTLALFYLAARHWHARRTAFLATILFATSGWFLLAGRMGTPDIMLPFAVLAFAVCGYWIAHNKRMQLGVLVSCIAAAALLYVPGVVLLLAIGVLLRVRKDIKRMFIYLHTWQRLVSLAIIIIGVILPIVALSIRNTDAIITLLGLPTDMLPIIDIMRNFGQSLISFFVYAPAQADMHLGHLPLLDIFTSVLVILGMYYYVKFRKLDRSKFLLAFFIIGLLLSSLGGQIHDTILLPVLYMLAASGLALLLAQWLTVFPKNPLARSIGVSLMVIAVSVSAFYNLRMYFVAWPSTPATKQSYNQTHENLLQ